MRPAAGGAPASSGGIPDLSRPARVVVPDAAALDDPTSARRPWTSGETVADPSPDAHIRRALALVELSRLVLDAD